MTTVPTPSDSQDGARRRDDAAYWKARWEAACERLDHGAAQTISLLAELRRRTTERDAARAELSANERSEDARLAIAEAERDEARAAQLRLLRELTATCSCGTSPMTYEGPEPDCVVHGAVRAFNEAAAELARMRPVDDAVAQLHRTYVLCGGRRMEPGDAWRMLNDFIDETLLAAVDQTTPSSPLATPHTADGGEAGVVEGAGGSEAAEGRFVMPPCEVCGGEVWEKSAEAVDRIVDDGRLQLVEVTVKPCGHEWYYDRQEASTDG